MLSSSISPAEFSALWTTVENLLSAGRWHDAEVTLRSAADSTGAPEIRLSLGTQYAERGHWNRAIQEWTQVIDTAQAAGRRDLLAAVYHNLSAIYRDLGDFELARRFQQRSLMWQDDCGPEDLLHLANDALAAGSYELAEMMLEAVEDVDDREIWPGTIEATQGLLCGLRGELRPAIRHLKQAYRTHLAQQNFAFAARDLVNLAEFLQQADRLRAAERCLAKAAEHFRVAGETGWQQRATGRLMRLRRVRSLLETPAAWN
ncbi:tetratricopeptide repeat protein [bacterium]|nr:tetratricopeptide repeat protein [bacterium]